MINESWVKHISHPFWPSPYPTHLPPQRIIVRKFRFGAGLVDNTRHMMLTMEIIYSPCNVSPPWVILGLKTNVKHWTRSNIDLHYTAQELPVQGIEMWLKSKERDLFRFLYSTDIFVKFEMRLHGRFRSVVIVII